MKVLAANVQQGNAYFGLSGKLSLALAGNLRATFANPAGSGKRVFVPGIVVTHNALMAWGTLYTNPVTNLPTTDRAMTNMRLGYNNPPASLFKVDTHLTQALSGGTTIGQVGIPTGRNIFEEHILLLEPGMSVGLNCPFLGIFDAEIIVYFWEEVI